MAQIKAYLNRSDARNVPAIVIMAVSIGIAVAMAVRVFV
jgi:hypothetical protein